MTPAPLDDVEAADAVAHLRRLTALDPGAVVRLRGSGRVLGVFGRPPLGVVTVRSVRLAAAADDLDATLPAAGLAAAWAGEAPWPAAAPPGAWPGPLPPAGGWVEHGRLPAADVAAARAWAAEAFRAATAALGPGATPAALEAVGEELWSREAGRVGATPVPLRLVHAGVRLGLVPPGDAPAVRTAGPWTALAGRHGVVLARSAGGLGPLTVR